MATGPIDWDRHYTEVELNYINAVLGAAMDRFHLTQDQLLGPVRRRPFTTARHATIAALYSTTTMSLPHLGALFGGRDHTTIMHSLARADEDLVGKLLDDVAGVREGMEAGRRNERLEADVRAVASRYQMSMEELAELTRGLADE